MSCDPLIEAARGALDLVRGLLRENTILGAGTGRTVVAFLNMLSRESPKSIYVVPSSLDTALLASRLGFRVLDPRTVESLDVYVDGADEVDERGFMLKGGGGAMLGEKIMAYSSSLNVFAVSEDKLVERIGSRRPIPVEVEPGYLAMVLKTLESMGLRGTLRESVGKKGPLASDWGGVIVDVETEPLSDPESLERVLKSVPGVLETGIFAGYADYVVVGFSRCGYRVLRFERTKRRQHQSFEQLNPPV
ncbi:MAG: ribose 5-phosphate isomerase A [Acidilobaceae archaeon]